MKVNQTDLHRRSVDIGGVTPGMFIRQRLRMPLEAVLKIKEACGMMFLEQNTSGLAIEAISCSEKYWRWWRKVWYITDMKLFCGIISSEIYVNAHNNITDKKVLESFTSQYEAFFADGLAAIKQGGVEW